MIVLLVACKGTTEADVKITPAPGDTREVVSTTKDLDSTESASEVTFSDQKYGSVYLSYLAVKAAMVNTNATTAQKEATALSQAADGIVEISEETRKSIKTIISETDIKTQRAAFEKVSKDLEVLFSGKITSGTIYKQYCPMAFNGEGGYWLSDSKEVRNPYYGDQMLTCGVVDSEIE